MIASLRGTVSASTGGAVVIDVGGVGLRAEVTSSCASRARVGSALQLFTQLVVREDSLTLFGFESADELELFNLLTTVSGVGPRLGLSVLSALSADRIVQAIHQGDEKAFTSVPGIGAKTAKLILVSLHGKVTLQHSATTNDFGDASGTTSVESVVIQALVGLGWTEQAGQDAVRAAKHAGAGEDQASLLKSALVLLQQSPVRS